MKHRNKSFYLCLVLLALAIGMVANPDSANACAACYGKSDSPLAAGMNWGIMCLLVFIFGVLCTIASFFVFLARKAASVAAGGVEGTVPETPTVQQSNNLEKV